MSLNTVTVSGNLTRDPELRMNANGTAFLNLGIAVNENRKNSQGEWEPYTHFFEASAVGKRAEALSRILTKGMKVAISGRLSWRQWESPDGGKRTAVSISVDEVDIMAKKHDNAGDGVAAVAPSPLASAPPSDDEIPF